VTPEQEAEALRLAELVAEKPKAEILHRARLLASPKDRERFGKKDGACFRANAFNLHHITTPI